MKANVNAKQLLIVLFIIAAIIYTQMSNYSIDIEALEIAQVVTLGFVAATGVLSWLTLNELKKFSAVPANK